MKKIAMVVLTGWLLYTGCAPDITAYKIKAIHELIESYTKINKFNGTALVSVNNQIILEQGYGYKNSSGGVSNDSNSIFQIYSITKTFTSTVIFRLIELNKLSLGDKLSKFYPSFPKGDSITIENLLTHTSGIYDYTQEFDFKDHSEKSLLTLLSGKPLDFSPGTGWRYSNSGYSLLGFIIGKVSGMPYEQAVRQYIFNPMKMTHSGFDFKNLRDTNKTTGYSLYYENVKLEVQPGDSTGPFAAGAIYSTAGDLYRFHQGLQSHRIISENSLEKAFAVSKTNKGYGHGWQLGSRFFRKKIVFHGGGAPGYRSIFSRLPADNICIVLLNNNENANLEFLAGRIYDIIYGKPVQLPAEIKLGKEILQQYTGTFVAPPFILYTTVIDGRLAIQVSGQGKTTLLAQKENYFSQEEANAFLEFPKGINGIYDELIVHQPGGDLHGKRKLSTWGLLGSATTVGWNDTNDIPFTKTDEEKEVWVLQHIKLTPGEIKFRYNNDWNVNYGDNENDSIPDLYGKNIAVQAGTYDIELDLSNELKPFYSIRRIN